MILKIKNKYKYLVVLAITILFYGNTLRNGYVIDDKVVIEDNDYVHNGIGGIVKILSNNSFAGTYNRLAAKEPYSGGRYRPLSVVVFAIEYSIFGDSPHAMHLVHLCFYILLLMVMFYFLDNFLCKNMPS